jgi:hypothetical protein
MEKEKKRFRAILDARESALRKQSVLIIREALPDNHQGILDGNLGEALEKIWLDARSDFIKRREMLKRAEKILPSLNPTFSGHKITAKELLDNASFYISMSLDDIERKRKLL